MPMTRHPRSDMRVTLSNRCAAAGVALLVVAWLSPADWYPVLPLFLGVAFLAVSHVLTPCEVRISQWRKSCVPEPQSPSDLTSDSDARRKGARESL